MRHAPSLAAIAAVVVVAGSGCATTPAPSPESTATEEASSIASSVISPVVPPEVGTVIDVGIAGGVVTPTNAEVEAIVGQPIVLNVNSDAPDSIHVHSVPEHVFDVQARPGQRFEFTVGVPGQVDVELHDLNRTIVTIAVRP